MPSAKSKANWVLKYVKSAIGETDCPDTIPEFIAQRRRWVARPAAGQRWPSSWLNGSLFAAVGETFLRV